MDVKYVLSSILREAEKFGGTGELRAGVRLSGAVNGERGEGYLMLYSDVLVLLYRRLGERDYEGLTRDLAEWSFETSSEEKYLIRITLQCGSESYACEFTPSERDSAEVIFNAITAAHAEPQAVYAERILIMAALIYLLSSSEHEKFAQELLGKGLWRAARKYAADKDLNNLAVQAGQQFTIEQKQSLMLNLIELRMSDDLWQSAEAAALKELAQVWELSEGFYENAVNMLLLRRQLGSLFQQEA